MYIQINVLPTLSFDLDGTLPTRDRGDTPFTSQDFTFSVRPKSPKETVDEFFHGQNDLRVVFSKVEEGVYL